jgi:hypothetical protein
VSDDLFWCDECGTAHGWYDKKRRTTPHRRLIAPITRPLYAIGGWCLRLAGRLYTWADKAERAKYEALRRMAP